MNKEPFYVSESQKRYYQGSMNQQEYEDVLEVVRFFVSKMINMVRDIPLQLLVTDEFGYIMEIVENEIVEEVNSEIKFYVGMQITEQNLGINSINLSLEHRQPIQVVGMNHTCPSFDSCACYSVPFHYSDEDNVLGTITIITSVSYQNPALLAMLSTLAGLIEREILLRQQNQRLHVLHQIMMNTSRNGIIITDRNGVITEYNEFIRDQFDGAENKLVGKSITEMESIGSYISNVLMKDEKYENLEIQLPRKDDSGTLICLFDTFPIFDQNNKLQGAFGRFRDITEHYKDQEKINYLAYHDVLTVLPNRRFFMQKITERVNMDRQPMAIMMLDLDRFKSINDILGHTHGDLLLQAVAQRLQSFVGSNGIVARMGGDEFMILFPKIEDRAQVGAWAEQLIEQCSKPILLHDYELYINLSVGIACYPDDGEDVETLTKHADIAMYRAKECGKGYMFYAPRENEEGLERIILETSLRKALKNEEFVLYYQPQVNINSREIVGIEALIRWQHPELGLLSPGVFISLAEEVGLITQIGEWVVKTACEQNKAWQQEGLPHVKVAVNLSAHHFLNQNIIHYTKQTLEDTGLDPEFLELEITESIAMDVENAIESIQQLKDIGVKISIDDFGTGYSSLYYLKKLSIDRLKIDQSFVRDIVTDSNDAAIVATIIAMAHNLGLEVIAEGVETIEQLQYLQTQKCEELQGFLFSKPVAAHEMKQLLHTRMELHTQ